MAYKSIKIAIENYIKVLNVFNKKYTRWVKSMNNYKKIATKDKYDNHVLLTCDNIGWQLRRVNDMGEALGFTKKDMMKYSKFHRDTKSGASDLNKWLK